MEEQFTFNDLIIETFNKSKVPMSAREIWDKAVDLGLDRRLSSKGKTPWLTISAMIYTNMKDFQDSSQFLKVSKRPTKFILRSLDTDPIKTQELIKLQEKNEDENRAKSKFSERDIHPLLVKYVYSNQHFNCYTKTIFHENSIKKTRGANEWLHPDLVGVYFPFNDYSKETRDLQTSLSVSSIKLYAFELKIHINYTNLRQSFFQAVSNSSWANEGYLVCLDFDDDPDFRNELQRLSNSFGIGIIKLNVESINESDVVFPARSKEIIDWDTVNRLAEDSPDFKRFISNLVEDIKLGKIKSNYDKVMNDEEFNKYLREKKII